MEGTFHRRELKAPAIAFSSKEGVTMFRDALGEGHMENYFFLSEQFTTQLHPAYCGIGSLSMALNALLIDPKRKWQGVWRWFDDEMLDCCELLDTIKEKGITLDMLGCVATCNGADSSICYGPDMTEEDFRKKVQLSCKRSSETPSVLIASYARGVLNQTGTGHFSPIGGYHEASDMVLIMDVARFKYPPHWVPLKLLHESMQLIDPDSNRPRGLLQVTAAQEGGLQCRMKNCCCVDGDNSAPSDRVSGGSSGDNNDSVSGS
eukprot:CAMPEP_0114433964 /NCGR_PEP_ID=MMETSP0103-20121206/11988_1 /TAXON_ID=37642 ORGANISM="Paraphysomonas imperforata, Strain PA2" /NCGR_SAMPLE_ID=MMETSP0103 /ASSEMBLY_ACC=CAM_ASM_000201 /LENGTH=261 /DNA_ID=CAMNT_0001603779 /DNA_START=112 /DNA_END=897 /DNA_ORIENTATION=-